MNQNSSSDLAPNWFLFLVCAGFACCLLLCWRDWRRVWRLMRAEWRELRAEWRPALPPLDAAPLWCESFESDYGVDEPLGEVMEQIEKRHDCAAMRQGAMWN